MFITTCIEKHCTGPLNFLQLIYFQTFSATQENMLFDQSRFSVLYS